jgi:hypothetical protein
MDLHDKINSISDKLEYISNNKEYANKWKYAINSVNNTANLESVCVLVNVTLDILEEKRDYRDGKIMGLQTKVSNLEKEYIITIIQASRNMEHYIIKKINKLYR